MSFLNFLHLKSHLNRHENSSTNTNTGMYVYIYIYMHTPFSLEKNCCYTFFNNFLIMLLIYFGVFGHKIQSRVEVI